MQCKDFKTFFRNFDMNSSCQTLSKTPNKFFDDNGFPEMKILIGKTYNETKVNIYTNVYGPGFCKNCGKKIERLMPGWRGWYVSCSEECRQKLASARQMGLGNTSHRISKENKLRLNLELSDIMKAKIKAGTFTPKSNNYKHQRPIKCILRGELTQVRSLWELIYRLNNPQLEYESVRIEYFDSIKNTNRIYIPDFYDKNTNTIIEIRPKAYQLLLIDKKKAVIEQGYNYIIIDEEYFETQKTPEMIDLIKSVVCDYNDVKKRLKWLKRA